MRSLVTGILVLAACCTLPAMAETAENLRVARAMVSAINARDIDALDALVAPDVVRHSAATAGIEIDSLDDFKAFLETDFATVPDSVMTIEIIFGGDEYVGMRALYAGTQKGAWGPFPATGREFELPFNGILRFEDGLIAEIWVEWDNVYALTQLGHFGQRVQ